MPEPVVVSLGDSIPSIALTNGYFWRTIWEYGPNAGLKAKRQNPNVLQPGDQVALPDKTTKKVVKPVDGTHQFKRRGEPSMLRLKLMLDDEPRAKEPYQLNIDQGRLVKSGTTDASGVLEEVIPGDARVAELILNNGKESFKLAVGYLNPIDSISGVQQRLNNLGFRAGAEDGEMNDDLRDALKRFQARYELTQSGEIDGAVKSKLQELMQ